MEVGAGAAPRPLYPWKQTRYIWHRKLEGSRTSLDRFKISCLHWDMMPGLLHPVTSCKINFVLYYHPVHVLCWSAAVGSGGERLTSHPIHFTACESSPIANWIIGVIRLRSSWDTGGKRKTSDTASSQMLIYIILGDITEMLHRSGSSGRIVYIFVWITGEVLELIHSPEAASVWSQNGDLWLVTKL